MLTSETSLDLSLYTLNTQPQSSAGLQTTRILFIISTGFLLFNRPAGLKTTSFLSINTFTSTITSTTSYTSLLIPSFTPILTPCRFAFITIIRLRLHNHIGGSSWHFLIQTAPSFHHSPRLFHFQTNRRLIIPPLSLHSNEESSNISNYFHQFPTILNFLFISSIPIFQNSIIFQIPKKWKTVPFTMNG